MEFLIIIVIGFFVIGFFVVKQNANKHIKLTTSLEKEFPHEKIHLDSENKTFLVVDFSNKQIVVGQQEKYKKNLPFSAIVKVEIIKNGAQISSTNRGSQALGAAVGAVAFGGVGAIIGALSGSSTTTSRIKLLSLKITVDDTDKPIHEVIFHKSIKTKGDKNDVKLVEENFNKIANFAAYLEKAIRESDESKQKATPQEKQPKTMTEQISELWKLKEAGALTQEEFDVQKTRLMGEAK